MRFANPYRGAVRPRPCLRAGIVPADSDDDSSLTFNTYLDKYVLVSRSTSTTRTGRGVFGFYYSTSEDLIHWEPRRLIREAEMVSTYECGDPNPVEYPSLLDPDSPSRNFETTGRTAWLYFTRFHFEDCKNNSNRDLAFLRVPVRFSK